MANHGRALVWCMYLHGGRDIGFQVMVSRLIGAGMDKPEGLGGDAADGIVGLGEQLADGVESLARAFYTRQVHEHIPVLHKGVAEPFLAAVSEEDPAFGCEPS